MKELLDKLIDNAPKENQGSTQVQLQIGGQNFAGAMKRSEEYQDLYELITVGHRPGQTSALTGQPKMEMFAVRVYFSADDVQAVYVPMEGDMDALKLATPGGTQIPGIA